MTTMKQLSDNLLTRLIQADIVCHDCGEKYGKYSVGCSSTWQAECPVCGETKGCTEVRDWGYLTKGIHELKDQIKEQSKEVADYMLSVGPIMNDDELEDELTPCYEQGEVTLKLTEAEVTAMVKTIDELADACPPGKNEDFDSAFMKLVHLYQDYCVKYELSPALKAYHAKYGTWGVGEDEERWIGFRDAFLMLNDK